MKKILFTLVMLIVSVSVSADGLDRLARKYKKCEGAIYAASIDELNKLNSGSRINIKTDTDRDDALKKFVAKMKKKGIRQMRVLDLEDCSFEDKARFALDATDAIPSAYEGFLNLSDNDGGARIYIQKRSDYIKILVMMTGDDNSGFVEIESDNSLLNSLLNFD